MQYQTGWLPVISILLISAEEHFYHIDTKSWTAVGVTKLDRSRESELDTHHGGTVTHRQCITHDVRGIAAMLPLESRKYRSPKWLQLE